MIIFFEAIRAIGELTVAYTAIRVHHRVLKEHRIDQEVERVMKREQIVGIAGIFLIVIGFIGEIFFQSQLTI